MENDMNNTFNRGYSKGLGFGFFLILVGALFLGFNFGIVPIELKWVLISWPMWLILFGVINLLKRKIVPGTILLLIGSFFLFPKLVAAYPNLLPGYEGNFTHDYWPVLLIAAGLLMISGKVLGPKWGFNTWSQNHHQQMHYRKLKNTKGNSNNGFSKNSIFGGGEHIVLEKEFTGGELNAIFGGLTLDLRHTNLPEGDTYLDINAVFGGITIYVPKDWVIVTQLDAVFGGFEDKRLPFDTINSNKKLIITGACVFGGGELLN